MCVCENKKEKASEKERERETRKREQERELSEKERETEREASAREEREKKRKKRAHARRALVSHPRSSESTEKAGGGERREGEKGKKWERRGRNIARRPSLPRAATVAATLSKQG